MGPLLAGLISPSGWNNVFYMLMVADACALLLLLRLIQKELQCHADHTLFKEHWASRAGMRSVPVDGAAPWKPNPMGHLIVCLKALCVVKSLAGLLGAVWDMVNPWSSDFCTWISTSGWPLLITEEMGTWGRFQQHASTEPKRNTKCLFSFFW